MTGNEALRELERGLIAYRGFAAADEAWAAYRIGVLPANLEPSVEAKMAQAFGAGYQAAMEATRMVLTRTQNSALGSRAADEPAAKVLINGVWVTPR